MHTCLVSVFFAESVMYFVLVARGADFPKQPMSDINKANARNCAVIFVSSWTYPLQKHWHNTSTNNLQHFSSFTGDEQARGGVSTCAVSLKPYSPLEYVRRFYY
jgi:hypothetical protein